MSADKSQLFLDAWKMFLMAQGLRDTFSVEIPQAEYNFDKHLGRKHRFDWAFVTKRIAVEVEGNAWNVRGGGRHMQDGDLEKYNIAAADGWRVFRFSPKMLKSDPIGCAEKVWQALR